MIASQAAVATPRPEAVRAARDVLEAGGNAVDAAVAAVLALCVVTPNMVGVGGYGGSMVIYHRATRHVRAIDFDSRAPLAYRDDLFADPKSRSTGYLSVSVPGVVAGLELARREFGTKTWAQLSASAIELAERGFPMDEELKFRSDYFAKNADPVSLRAQFKTGTVPAVGELFVQRDLAGLLKRLASEGPGAFYDGEIPRTIVEQVHAHGGILAEEDFAKYRAAFVDPLTINYRGRDLFTPPPPSGGITSLSILKTLEQFEVGGMDANGSAYYHLFAEAAMRCFLERQRHLGDPDFVKVPIDDLLSAKSAAARAAEIRKGDLARGAAPPDAGGPHTANVCVVDRERNVVSLTATQGYQFGACVCIEGLGLILGHGMSRFDYLKDHPNSPAPGKRMLHNMSPMLIGQGGDPIAAIGLPGGTKISTVTAQLAANLIDFARSAHDTVTAPRVHIEPGQPLAVSSRVPDAVIDELKAMGHTVRRGQDVGGPKTEIAGMANAITIDAKTGALAAASTAGDACAGVF